MRFFWQIGIILLFTLIIAGCSHDKSEEYVQTSTLELVKSGKKKPKMVYSTGEKSSRLLSPSPIPDENLENLEVTLEVNEADLHIHCEGFMEQAYLFIQDQSHKVIFTQIIALIDEDHPLDVYIPEAEGYPYYLQIESEKYIARINIWLE